MTLPELDFNDKKTLEKYSSAFTLSDMEIFIFPEIFYPLVISNIMSPVIWKWRDDPWFKDIHKKSFTYKVNRIKQFIMDHYVFNLDLETWGLTTKDAEIERFKDFFDIDFLRQSNALFGYEGDKYYFDIDIRKHFGLDQYTTDVIPYWKTETVEAMSAFPHKEGFTTGAGECVSLASLYAAAMFIVGQIPLEKIFLLGTPLHSQNFVNENGGILTNNRRIVTKNMWFNGTALSAKSRRALENERVTIVSHITGHIHTSYPEASIQPEAYSSFAENLRKYLITDISAEIFLNYLRHVEGFKKCFQYCHTLHGKPHYIGMEKVFEYEHTSRNSFNETTRAALLTEIDMEEFSPRPLEGRLCLSDIENYLKENKNISFEEVKTHFLDQAKSKGCNRYENIELMFKGLAEFMHTEPRLPKTDKNFVAVPQLKITTTQSREEIIDLIVAESSRNEMARLSLYAHRPMDLLDWKPFLKAAFERNPVANIGLSNMSIDDAYQCLKSLGNESIYDANRLALPDEVWNFQTGDGVEKAIALANYIISLDHQAEPILDVDGANVRIEFNGAQYEFVSEKHLKKRISLCVGIHDSVCC